ncbi:MAG: hypothetical protein AAGB12_03190 [Pseudomonadota bacterium]
MQFFRTLQARVVLAFAVLLITTLITVKSVLTVSHDASRLIELSRDYLSFHSKLENIHGSTTHYLKHAARDYQSYYRDLDVYFIPLEQNLESMTKVVASFVNNPLELSFLTKTLLSMNHFQQDDILKGLQSTHDNWQTFILELREKLGEDLNEPRIEWGAQYIQEKSTDLQRHAGLVNQKLSQASKKLTEHTQHLSHLLIVWLILFSGLFAVWFYKKILKPLKITDANIQRLTMRHGKENKNHALSEHNEVEKLKSSLEQLTKHYDALLSITSQIARLPSMPAIVNMLNFELSQRYKVDGAFISTPAGLEDTFSLQYVTPNNSFRHLKKLGATLNTRVRDNRFLSQESLFLIADVDQYLAHKPPAPLIKLIQSQYPIKSLLLIPLYFSGRWQHIVLLSFRSQEFSDEFAILMEAIQPFLQNALEGFTTNKQEIYSDG